MVFSRLFMNQNEEYLTATFEDGIEGLYDDMV